VDTRFRTDRSTTCVGPEERGPARTDRYVLRELSASGRVVEMETCRCRSAASSRIEPTIGQGGAEGHTEGSADSILLTDIPANTYPPDPESVLSSFGSPLSAYEI